MALSPGTQLGPYEIVSQLGSGGMGVVYQAHDPRLDRHVAIKLLPPDLTRDETAKQRFLQEAKAASALDHPNICTIHDVGETDDGQLYLVMAHYEGETLKERIGRGPLDLDDAVDIATQVGQGLAKAHSAGIVHRDIKPANLMVTGDGVVKILDFGLAKLAGAEGVTQTGTTVGTVAYMSPEQARGQEVDHRTDIWSLGVVLYEMLAGEPPFQGENLLSLAEAIRSQEPDPLTGAASASNGPVSRALSKEVGQRYAAVAGFVTNLRKAASKPEPVFTPSAKLPPNNLPSTVDSFVGRADELTEVSDALTETSLVTLTGVGGTGKTRLATEVATDLLRRFTDGAWLAELAPVTHEEGVPHAVADVVGAMQQPDKTMTESLVAALKHRSALVVLDNCEHVLDAAANLAEAVTTQCPNVRILATSREGLAIRGERVMRVASLSDVEGGELFRDRAEAAGSTHEMKPDVLTRLSARLDGIPLAIELAAARSTGMSPEEIEQRLDDRFRLLRGSRRGRMERHQTLRNTVAWSYELLERVEQQVFDRLSSFAGGFTREAAAAVAGGDDIDALDVEDAIAALVDRSMVLTANTEDGTRFRLLETLRQFGEERLIDSGQAPATRTRHVEWFAAHMREAWKGLSGADDARWMRVVGHEFENLRTAVYTAIDTNNGRSVTAMLKPLQVWAHWSLRYEVGEWAEAALEVDPEPPHARAAAVYLLAFGGRPDDATRLAAALDGSEIFDLDEQWMRKVACAAPSLVRGIPDDRSLREAAETAARSETPVWATFLAGLRVPVAVMAGRMGEAKRMATKMLDDAKRSGNVTVLGLAHFAVGRAYSDDEPDLALRSFERAIEMSERYRAALIAGVASTEAAAIVAREGEPHKGGVRLARALRSFIGSGDLYQLWTSAHHLAYFLVRLGRMEDARAIWGGLGHRPAFAAQHHRDELKGLLGAPDEGELSDDDMVDRIQRVLDTLEAETVVPVGGPTSSASAPTVAIETQTEPDTPSIAVLPFANMSADPEQEYFCDGLSEELIDALARLDGLRVVARTSAFQFRGKGHDLRVVGQKLKVKTVLEGSVRKAGNRLRVNAQLINAEDGYHLWTERYDRTMDDVFEVQDGIARSVAGELRVKLLGKQDPPIVKRPTDNLDAYTLYLKARHFSSRFTKEGLTQAVQHLKQAVSAEPYYAQAHAELASAYTWMAWFSWAPTRQAMLDAKEAALKAISIDDGLCEAHTALGLVYDTYEWDWSRADQAYQRAIAFSPGDALTRSLYAFLLMHVGRTTEAVAQARRGVELDPLSVFANRFLAMVLNFDRKFDEAQKQAEAVLALDPADFAAYLVLGSATGGKKEYRAAAAWLERGRPHAQGDALLEAVLGWAYGLSGEADRARVILTDLKRRHEQKRGTAFLVGYVYLGLGQFDEALDWLTTACERREGHCTTMLVHPHLDPLRSDPRFQALLRRMNFPQHAES